MKRLTYKSAGVNRAGGERLAEFAKAVTRRRRDPNVLAGVGGFGSLYRIPMKGKQPPILVSGTDGVGTKLRIAFLSGKHDTVGIDCVAMCANDVACQGAQPLFFLDYIGIGKLTAAVGHALVRGVEAGCALAGCSLVGGETAELGSIYAPGEYDFVGFCVGAVEEDEMVDGRHARPGDVVIGVGSAGLHSNGFSLVNRLLIDRMNLKLDRYMPDLGCRLGEELLRPTKIYVRTIRRLMQEVPVLALGHITGSGLPGKCPRQLPQGLGVRLTLGTWPIPPVFTYIERHGRIARREMFDTFNMGVGLTVVTRRARAEEALKILLDSGERAQVIGEVVSGRRFSLVD